MATIKDVALLARVSTGTVSNVLNNNPQVGPQIRERVKRVVGELDFHPNALARSLKTKHSKTAGMVVTDIMNPFYPAVVRGAEDVLARAGYTLIVGNSDGDVEKEDAYYRLFASKRVDGLLLITRATAEESLPALANCNTPSRSTWSRTTSSRNPLFGPPVSKTS